MTDIDETQNANTFTQPSLDAPVKSNSAEDNALPAVTSGKVIVNSDKTDELSVALANSRLPKPVDPELEKPKPPGKYALEYSLKGQYIKETHATLEHALSRIAALGRLGIVPATSTIS